MSALRRAAASDLVAKRFVDVDGVPVAHRRLGPAYGVPLLLLQRFRGTLDHWDPRLRDRLAASRRVLLYLEVGRRILCRPSQILRSFPKSEHFPVFEVGRKWS